MRLSCLPLRVQLKVNFFLEQDNRAKEDEERAERVQAERMRAEVSDLQRCGRCQQR